MLERTIGVREGLLGLGGLLPQAKKGWESAQVPPLILKRGVA